MNQKDYTGGKPAVVGSIPASDKVDPLLVVDGDTAEPLDDPIDDSFFVREIG
jgi:hypothetical protein